MSIVLSHSDGWILCHSTYLHEQYKTLEGEEVCKYCGKYDAFHISSPFLKIGQKNSKSFKVLEETEFVSTSDEKIMDHVPNSGVHEVKYVENAFTRFINDAKSLQYPKRKCILRQNNNEVAINAFKRILERLDNPEIIKFHGRNSNSYPISITHSGVKYFIPPLCTFYNCPVTELQYKLVNQDVHSFDVILLDPPWWNKHIRRKNARDPSKGYKMMYDEDLLKIPVDKLLALDGLVVVWCTNSKQHINYLIDTVFPVWKISYLTTWYWVKITDNCTPVCDFSSEVNKKQPFERIIFGSRPGRSEKFKNPDPYKLIISVPSAVHSHKPPLTNVLSEYIPVDSHCIELFARYLIPKWISCGNEVLKLQQKCVYTSSLNTKCSSNLE